MCSEEPTSFVGETPNEVVEALKMALKGCEKKVLDYDKIGEATKK
jgi:predicted RNase H-like HicB family nuclease